MPSGAAVVSSKSCNVLPSLVFHDTQPLQLFPVTNSAALDGLVNRTSSCKILSMTLHSSRFLRLPGDMVSSAPLLGAILLPFRTTKPSAVCLADASTVKLSFLIVRVKKSSISSGGVSAVSSTTGAVLFSGTNILCPSVPMMSLA